MNLRELDKEFTKRGVNFKQEVKNDELVIYRCTNIETKDEYFEVFKYRTAKPHPMDEGTWDLVELYPSDNAFGVWAWCCSSVPCVNKVLKKHFGIEEAIL